MQTARLIAAMMVIVASAASATAASPEAPLAALSCSGCHAGNVNVHTPVPRLEGRKAADIVDQMQAFRAGKRDGTVMDRIAKGFSDTEIQAIAAWYAGLR